MFFKVDAAVPGDMTIAAGIPNRAAALTSVALMAGSASVTFQWKSINPGVSTTTLSGPMQLTLNSPYILPLAPGALQGKQPGEYLQALPGENLTLTLGSGSIQVSGHGTYSMEAV